MTKCPDLIDLNPLTWKIYQRAGLVVSARTPNIREQFIHCVDRAISNAGCGAEGVAFAEELDDECAFF